MQIKEYLNQLFNSFVTNTVNQSALVNSQLKAIAETFREMGANLAVVTIVTFIIDSKPNYINQSVTLMIAGLFWYTGLIIYRELK